MANNSIDNEFVSSGTEDAYFKWKNANQIHSMGLDTGDNNKLKITDSTTPSSGNSLIEMTTVGQFTFPQQPVFSAFLTDPLNNVTGDGTVVNPVIFNELTLNQGGHYEKTTGIFTAPIAGNYHFTCGIGFSNLIGGHNAFGAEFVYSTAKDHQIIGDPGNARIPAGSYLVNFSSGFVRLIASETVKIVISVSGASLTVDLLGRSGTDVDPTFFSGSLMS